MSKRSDILEGIALHLQGKGLASYKPVTTDGTCFLEQHPKEPDAITSLWLYGGEPADGRNPWEFPRLQVRVRGTKDASDTGDRADDIYSELHALGPLELPTGVWLQYSYSPQSGPVPLGPDANGRPEYTVNFQLDIDRATEHR